MKQMMAWCGIALTLSAWADTMDSNRTETPTQRPASCGAQQKKPEHFLLHSMPAARFHFDGMLGKYIDATIREWIMRAPEANPGMLEQLRRRDAHTTKPDLVPWVSEFPGKYLMSAVQAVRLSDDPELRAYVQGFVDEFIATQAPDGYLGAWPANEAGEHLLTVDSWDLWALNHAICGLLMWYDESGDTNALACAQRAADQACAVYLDKGRRLLEMQASVMNLGVIQSFAWLYERTGNERYRQFMKLAEEDWNASTEDYFRQGLAGTPMYLLPSMGCRWESLVDFQGMAELYGLTGDPNYKKAFTHYWHSIRQLDRHPSGAFSTNECAVGYPYYPFERISIETCCSVAWEAMSTDMLRLTADASAADELELTTWNEALASLHPSGSWSTYNTPLNGSRMPSYLSINFQSRPGAADLNCCSVNAFRLLGVLSEWAVMQAEDGLAVHFYGPSEIKAFLKDGTPVTLTQETEYPLSGQVRVRVGLKRASEFTLRFRIPHWSKNTQVRWGTEMAEPDKGGYFNITKKWKNGDVVELAFDMTPYHWTGELTRDGSAALYIGPILLAADTRYNAMDLNAMAPLDLKTITFTPQPVTQEHAPGKFQPMAFWDAATPDGTLRLCDFASAGVHGTYSRVWLSAKNGCPPPNWLSVPQSGAVIAAGPVCFRWTAFLRTDEHERTFTLRVARDAAFTDIVQEITGIRARDYLLNPGLAEAGRYYWDVTAHTPNGERKNELGAGVFTVDAALENTVLADLPKIPEADEPCVASALDGNGVPSAGKLLWGIKTESAPDRFQRENGAMRFNGEEGSGIFYEQPRYAYQTPRYPEQDLSFSAWICPEGLNKTSAVFSCWDRPGLFNSLAIYVHEGKLLAITEDENLREAPGAPVEAGKWIHVAAVKKDDVLCLYINGKETLKRTVKKQLESYEFKMAVGANPCLGTEAFVGSIDDFRFYARALSQEEVERLCQSSFERPSTS